MNPQLRLLIWGFALSIAVHAVLFTGVFQGIFSDFQRAEGTITVEVAPTGDTARSRHRAEPSARKGPSVERGPAPAAQTEGASPSAISAPSAVGSQPEVDPENKPDSETASEVGTTSATVDGRELGLRPHYPKISRMLGEVGRVTIEAFGAEATTIVSSGFGRLDEAALKAVVDALREGTLPPPSSPIRISFQFRLTSQDD